MMRSSHVVVLFIFISVLAAAQSTAQQPAAAEEPGVVAQIRALENELARAVVSRDYVSLSRIEADTYVYTDSDTHVNTRDEFIAAYRSGKSKIPMLRLTK